MPETFETPSTRQRPALSGRAISGRLSALSTVSESGQDGGGVAAGTAEQQEITEELDIDEIRRYEDFTTIDWVQDAAREQIRRRGKRKESAGFFFERRRFVGWRQKVWELYDAGQAWIVVTLVGAAIGLNAAFLNIVTEWLSDIKLGHCTTAFYLNENFCCWGAENGRFGLRTETLGLDVDLGRMR